MKTSQNGINLIKEFEGCRLTAYKPVPTEQYWTIGYGHYGPDVTQGMKISQAQAEMLLAVDLQKFENAVAKYAEFPLTQNQFDALVSFAYNCGAGNVKKLLTGRNVAQVADAMLRYDKGGGKVLAGLTRRRKKERELFLNGASLPATGNPYDVPTKSIKLNSKGNGVRWLQYALNSKGGYKLIVDGIAGPLTIGAVMDWQKTHNAPDGTPLAVDGIAGPKTIASLQ